MGKGNESWWGKLRKYFLRFQKHGEIENLQLDDRKSNNECRRRIGNLRNFSLVSYLSLSLTHSWMKSRRKERKCFPCYEIWRWVKNERTRKKCFEDKTLNFILHQRFLSFYDSNKTRWEITKRISLCSLADLIIFKGKKILNPSFSAIQVEAFFLSTLSLNPLKSLHACLFFFFKSSNIQKFFKKIVSFGEITFEIFLNTKVLPFKICFYNHLLLFFFCSNFLLWVFPLAEQTLCIYEWIKAIWIFIVSCFIWSSAKMLKREKWKCFLWKLKKFFLFIIMYASGSDCKAANLCGSLKFSWIL